MSACTAWRCWSRRPTCCIRLRHRHPDPSAPCAIPGFRSGTTYAESLEAVFKEIPVRGALRRGPRPEQGFQLALCSSPMASSATARAKSKVLWPYDQLPYGQLLRRINPSHGPWITERLQRRSARRAQNPNIPHWWVAEETAVFAVELARTFVSDFKGSACGVEIIDEHASPRGLQPKLLLILRAASACG